MEVVETFLAGPLDDGEAKLRTGLSPQHKQSPLHLSLLPVLLPSVKLVERHLVGVSLNGHYVGVNLNYNLVTLEQNKLQLIKPASVSSVTPRVSSFQFYDYFGDKI